MSDPANHGPWLSTATALFFTWALLTLAVRIWVKLRRSENWGHDDSTISAAFVIALAHISVVFHAVNAGYGEPTKSLSVSSRTTVDKSLFAAQILYILGIGMTKVSTGFFVARLTRYGPQVKVAYSLAGFSGLWTIASVLAVAIRGNMSDPWATLDGQQSLFVRWVVIEVIGIVIEVALLVLSVNLIWGLHMSLQKRVIILAAFGCRLVLAPIVAVRLVYLSPSQNNGPIYPNILAAILTEAALEYSLFSASITCLKPFLQPFHSGFIVNSVGAPGSGLRSGDRSKSTDPYYELSTVKDAGKDGAVLSINEMRRSMRREESARDRPYRGDYGQFSGSATTPPAFAGQEEMEAMRQSEGSQSGSERPMVITETKTVVVSEKRVDISASSGSS